MSWGRGLTGALVASVITVLALPGLIAWLTRRGSLDVPGHRSLHDVPTPRGGGAAPVVAFLIGTCVAGGLDPRNTAVVVGLVGLLGCLGFVDDLATLPANVRLAGQAVVAVAAVLLLDPPAVDGAVGAVLAIFWLVAFVNAFNFMDGVNGLASVQAVIAGVAWLAIGHIEEAPGLAWGGAVLAAASLAFLPSNFPTARVFLGDAGSYGLGGAAGVLVLIGLAEDVPLLAVAAPLSLFLADTGSTMVKRAVRRERLLEAHRDHVFQQLASRGWGHTRITLAIGSVIVGLSCAGALSLAGGPWPSVGAVIVGAMLVAYLLLPITALGSRRSPQRG
jgi:UDP-GlcNAc:undecaprenyl-phosphate GlcNAc-1-phosphate transferase